MHSHTPKLDGYSRQGVLLRGESVSPVPKFASWFCGVPCLIRGFAAVLDCALDSLSTSDHDYLRLAERPPSAVPVVHVHIHLGLAGVR